MLIGPTLGAILSKLQLQTTSKGVPFNTLGFRYVRVISDNYKRVYLMKEITVPTFENLEEQVDKLKEIYGRHSLGDYSIKNSVLFRGQANHKWELESTLERASKQQWTLKRYFRLIKRIRPIIESYYPLPFSQPSDSEVDDWFRNTAKEHGVINIPAYDYLLYLRHHGFPSPFVDWTTSLYIAAGFAFVPESNAEHRVIYMYIETPTGVKGGAVGDPEIAVLGPYVKTHKRHFLQQADYTICFRRTDETIPLERHDKIVANPVNSQDLLWKFILPSSERDPVLRLLASVNINPFSLMPSEENLLATLWLSEVILPYFDWKRHNLKPEA